MPRYLVLKKIYFKFTIFICTLLEMGWSFWFFFSLSILSTFKICLSPVTLTFLYLILSFSQNVHGFSSIAHVMMPTSVTSHVKQYILCLSQSAAIYILDKSFDFSAQYIPNLQVFHDICIYYCHFNLFEQMLESIFNLTLLLPQIIFSCHFFLFNN